MFHKHSSMQSICRFLMAVMLAFGMAGLSTQSATASAPDTTATRVYGQGGSFITGDPIHGGLNADSLAFPGGLALESNGSLYVADTFNNRVLYFTAGSTTAGRVYGQGGSFITQDPNKGGISANSLFFYTNSQFSLPGGLAVDNSGGLYVTDSLNNRVLYFTAGSTTATRVYGQGGSFTTNAANNGGINANSLYTPSGLALDSSGNLYVADSGNNRVLYYPSGSTTATRVYGQGGSFSSNSENNGGISANSLYYPSVLALDSSGDLYVADSQNSRVLYFPAGSTTAVRVYGQLGYFISNLPNINGVTADSLGYVFGLALDGSGDLFVADSGNNRVLYYPAGSTTATAVYGQAGSLTSNTANKGGISASSLYFPSGLALGSTGNLYVAELFNNRVLVYPPSGSITSGAPVMELTGHAQFINNNDTSPSTTDGTNFGDVAISGAASQTFTIFNNGTADLHLTDYARVTLSGPDSGDFSLTSAPTTPVAPGEATTFTVQFAPSVIGTRSATVNIGNDGSLNNSFTFTIQGTGFQASPTTAIQVYGQGGSLITLEPNKGGLNADSLFFPEGLAVDGSRGLYVSDLYNNRVLYYPAGSTAASRVYGQGSSFTTGAANKNGISADSLFLFDNQYPGGGLALDHSGNLYVADSANNRVLYYPAGSTTATRVYGQGGSFTTNDTHAGNPLNPSCYADPALGANSLNHPSGVALDSNGNLYVADAGNSRVLYYPAGSTTATRLYGHGGDFTYCFPNWVEGGPNADSLYSPFGLVLDSADNLYVADTLNNRVLFYQFGSTAATRVYGQGGSFSTITANTGGVIANSLYNPYGLALDSNGGLYVSDTGNNRVLYFSSSSTTATRVYGQGGIFTSNISNNGGISANCLYIPSGLALGGDGSLYVADTGNNRVLGYSPATLPSPGTPAMSMTGKSRPIYNGSDSPSLDNGTDFGITTSPFGAVSRDFAIFNTGTGKLNLTGYPRVAVSGTKAGDFSLVGVPPASPVAPGGAWTIFTVQFRPSALGTRSATISIANDDSDNTPFTFAVQGTGSAAPSVTAQAATGLTFDGATLHGTVNANYSGATVTFMYGTTAALGSSVTGVPSPVTGSTDTPVSATLSGLQPTTLYHFRLYATNASGTTRSDDMTFTTSCYSNLSVTSSADDEAGSLRQAIAQVCSGGTITFAAGLSAGTILLSTPLYLQKNLTIDGSGLASPVTISGNHAVSVFTIPQNVTVTLKGLNIVDGNSDGNGGGIFTMGTLTVTDSTISGNTAANIGGGIVNGGTLTVTGSTLVDNHADSNGGGIWSENYNVKVINSTLQGNSADWYGGGIYLRNGTLTLLNSTLSGNSALHGGGGINDSGTLNYANTIIAASTSGGDCVSATLGTNTNNLVQDGSCSAGLSGDPKLGVLADNGGPTQTMALLTGSPAIDTGLDAVCAAAPVNNKDQRGATRPKGTHCDIGAFEYIDPTQVSLRSFTGWVEKKPAAGDGTSILLSWETTNETDNLGFNLYRATSPDGARVKLNAGMIPTLVPPGSPYGAVYHYTDTGLLHGTTCYWLEAVDIHGGKELTGPIWVKVVVGKVK